MNVAHFLRNLMLPLDRIDGLLPESGLMYDIGCGMGVISRYIAKQPKRRVIAIDTQLDRIDQSVVAGNLTFVEADALAYKYLPMGGATMSDFLHHLPEGDQDILLLKIAKKMEKGGVLVIKEIDKIDGWRKLASRLWDFFLYPEDRIFYREKSQLQQYLIHLGFKVKVTREVPWFPGSTYLFTCKKV